MTRVFSGIQPTGELHIGNYLGAIQNWVKIQNDHECIYCIVDYHAITSSYEPAQMPGRVFEVACGLLAAGIDPDKSTLFVQSDVPQHTELAWAFASVTPMGELSRQTQFKAKSAHQEANINVGLFTYPVLQAADILLYKASLVPVGEDQQQHLELSREIARKFNARFGEGTFPEAQTMFTSTPRIRGLDGQAKMSKSLGNTILVAEDPKELRKKLAGAYTDPSRLRKSDPGDPDICNIFTIHKFFSSQEERAEIDRECRKAGIGCVQCKKMLADNMEAHFGPIQQRWTELRADPDQVWDILERGAAHCREIAGETLEQVRSRMGLR